MLVFIHFPHFRLNPLAPESRSSVGKSSTSDRLQTFSPRASPFLQDIKVWLLNATGAAIETGSGLGERGEDLNALNRRSALSGTHLLAATLNGCPSPELI
jgi:hypothetical protein